MRRLMPLMLLFCLALFALAPFATPARADGPQNYDALFNPKNVWLNAARPLTQKDAEGRMVLLDFWTYGCINCMQVVPDLKALEDKFGDKLLIIGVHSAKFVGERGNARIAAAAKRFGLTHPVINDSDFSVWDAFKVQAWPTLVLLDGKGNEFSRYAGEGHREDLMRDVARGITALTPEKAQTPLADLRAKDKDHSILSFPARLGYAKGTPWGDLLFIADSGHNRLLGATLDGKVKVTIGSGKPGHADGSFDAASFYQLRGFAVTPKGIYIADTGNHLIRYADFAKKTVTRVAGTGTQGHDRDVRKANALKTAIASPWDVKMMPDGTTLAIAMAGLHQIWMLDTANGRISASIGTGREDIEDGKAANAALAQPSGLSVSGDTLYFVDAETSALRELTKDGKVKTLIGTGLFDFGLLDGTYPKAHMQHAQGLDAHLAKTTGRIIVADTYNAALRAYDLKTGQLSTIKLPERALTEPGDVLQLDGKIYVADTDAGEVKVVDAEKGTIGTLKLEMQ
ncbi:MAG: redoxin domain-containing protein [Alphaproteobacteria bacterium]|nr:redoxin domain-containing protein [Alphaproteobacteria bacterium]